MKKWNGVILSAFFLMTIAGAAFAADLKVNGEYRVRGYSYNDMDGNSLTQDGSDYFDQRFLLKGSISQGITTGIFEMQMVNSSNNGQGGYILGTGPAFGGTVGSNGTNQGVGIYQAYLSAKWSGATLNAGRQELKLGHGMVFYSTADGITMAFPMEIVEFTAGYLKIKEANAFKTGASTDTDENALLFSFVTKSSGSNFGAFYVADSDKSNTLVSGSDSTTNIFGIFYDSPPGPSGVAIEYDNISGQDGCVLVGTACTLTAGATPLNRVGTNLFVGGHSSMGSIITGIAYIRATGASAGSTTDISYNSLGGGGDFGGGHGVLFYNPTHFHNGVDFNSMETALNKTTAIPATGIHAVRLSADFVPNPMTVVSLQYFPFVHITDVLPGNSDNVGTEFNISVDYAIDKNLKINTVYAYFSPGDGIQPATPATIMEFHAGLTFTF